MFHNVWSISNCFDIPDNYVFTSFKAAAGFTFIILYQLQSPQLTIA